MIDTLLLPATLPLDVSVDAVLRLRNVGPASCANVVFEFDMPRQLTLELGRRSIELTQLKPDQPYDHPIRVRAVEAGPCDITVSNFSFRDGFGRSRRIHDRSIRVEIQSGPQPPSRPAEPPGPPPGQLLPPDSSSVFISYRRSDADWVASRLAEQLRRHIRRQRVFLDKPSIRPGENFVRRLDRELQSCVALLAVIGPQWLETMSRYLETQTRDYVRYEIAAALNRDILLIPVLFDTTMPAPSDLPSDIRAMAYLQAKTLDSVRFNADVLDIYFAIRGVLEPDP